jgi:uncharacterized protein YbcI
VKGPVSYESVEAPGATSSPSAQISRGVVKLIRDIVGRGPTKARTTIGHDLVVVVLADTLTKGEIQLANHGETELVLNTRHKVQRIMKEQAVELVEAVVGRKVIAFMSANHIDPDMAVEVFVLAPESGADEPSEG